MRTVRVHLEAVRPEPELALRDELLLGLTEDRRFWLNGEIARVVRDGIDAGVDWRHQIVHVEPDSVSLRPRAEYVDELKRCGARRIAKELARAVVPTGNALAYIDLEGSTWTALASIVALLGEPSA